MIKHKSINYIHFTTIPSTNLWVKENASLLDPSKITCVTAEEQTAGKGQFGKKWISPKGLNIYATFYFTLPRGYPFLQNLGQLLSISICKALESIGFHTQIKWPNDLLLENKKIGGILCETTPVGEKIGIALGFGLNVNMPTDLTKKVDQPATSLLEVSKQNWDLEEILSKITTTFSEDFNILSLKGFSAFSSYYNEKLHFKGQTIEIKDGVFFRKGICIGSTADGELLLETSPGKQIKILTGKIES